VLTASIVLALLTSCGGGGGTQVAEGGIGGTGVSQGKVSGYGSLFVNGVEFFTDTATFIVEEETGGTEQEIKLGMVVQVTGEHDDVTGTAETVSYSSQMKGILTAAPSLDANGNGSLEVMRQTVYVNQTSIFEDATNSGLLITDLAQDDVVEISGFSDGSGTVYATRVELLSPTSGTLFSIKGVVTNLTGTHFDIGGLTIDFSQASVLPDAGIVEDTYVEAEGASFDLNGYLVAGTVELEGDGTLEIASDGEQVTAEGVITSSLIDDLFSLNGQWVSVMNLTGIDPTQFTIGRELKVSGVMTGGILEASEVAFQATAADMQEMSHTAEADPVVDINSINSGSLTLLGQTVTVTPSTLMKDDLGDDQDFNLAAISAGDYIEADVYDDGAGLVALKLERESTPSTDPAEVEGLVQEVNVNGVPNHIRVLDVLIDISGTGINPSVEDRVEISGDYDGTILSASEAEIED
jgi:hypothetical protein